ncbi:hypothetical protein [Caulobacter sp. 17J65-9]|uniref:hypothetical protein n=1 Tax=Caulobacter sp. 17J65-9 TaxID=2709382 RepID=UPI0013C8FEC1|nr:hypothetical protein [Caulobacter sp. 17J65-9]NEX91347.1 hypothetical protein [Caulobacter sp. 17J65-9]
MSLVALVFAAALAEGPPAPPATLPTPAEAAAYQAWLREDFIRREAFFSHQPACVDAVIEPIRTQPGNGRDHHYERARVSGCGRSSVQNIAVGRRPEGGWQSAALLPGLSRADLQLTVDVFQALGRGVATAAPGCDAGDVVWGEISSEPYRPDGSWTEIWPINACGQDLTVQVAFTPSARGGTDYATTQLRAPKGPAGLPATGSKK